jgi:2-polyprenyl-6-methoxyphenol hydroxylase-like FAD-dependent oxidoreductase
MGIHLGPLTVPKSMYAKKRVTPGTPHPNTLLIPQNRTDGALHARLCTLGVDVEFGSELTVFHQDAAVVTADVATGTGAETVRARYVVGADGASSVVRKQLGIAFVGSTDDADRMLIVDAVTDGLSRNRWHVWPSLSGRFVGACPLPHGELFQWMIKLAPEEEPPTDAAQINQRIKTHLRSDRVSVRDIQWRSVFRPNVRLAESYRIGRVLIAGDAAHVHTPAGAQGLNTGVQDGYNLGWKIAQVIAGADERLLDTYEAERQPIAAAVLGLSTRKYQALGKLDPSSIKRGKDESQLLLTYHGGPLAPIGTERTTTLRVGDRAPDADLSDADGKPLRLFDYFRGPHFTALAYGPHAAAELARLPWPKTGAALTRIGVDAGASDIVDALSDAAGTFARAYGLGGDALFLIRPDGYIGHIATHDMLSSTEGATRMMTPSEERR